MTESLPGVLVWYVLAAVTLGAAAVVAFSTNIVRSAFALFATFLGVAGLYVMLSADLLAVVQVMVYAGGIMVLMLFAVMLTSGIADVRVSNQAFGRPYAAVILVLVVGSMVYLVTTHDWGAAAEVIHQPSTEGIGRALLGRFILPFEVASVVLLAALVGAVMLARGVGNTEPTIATVDEGEER